MQRACAFPYYISWKVNLLFRENFYWQETISLLFDEIFQEFPGWVDPLLLADHRGSITFFAAHIYIPKFSYALGFFFRYIGDIQVVLVGFFQDLKGYK